MYNWDRCRRTTNGTLHLHYICTSKLKRQQCSVRHKCTSNEKCIWNETGFNNNMKMKTNIFCIYLSGRKKTTNNLLRILSHILSFMLLQNKYKKCDYCLLFLSSFCVVCVLFLILSFPFWMTLSFKRVRRRGARLAHNKHSTQGWCVLYSCLVLCRLLLSCLVFDFFLSSCILLSCILLSCLVFLCLLCSCLVLTSSFLISLRPSFGIVLISGASRSKETTKTTNGLCLPLSCHYLDLYSLVWSCLVLCSLVLSSLVLSCLLLSSLFLSCLDLKFSYLPQAVFRHRPHLWSVSVKRNNTNNQRSLSSLICLVITLFCILLSCRVLSWIHVCFFQLSSLVLSCLV